MALSKAQMRAWLAKAELYSEHNDLAQKIAAEEGCSNSQAYERAFNKIRDLYPEIGEDGPEDKERGTSDEPIANDGMVSKFVFEGKSCSITEAVEWVAKNMRIADVSADEAPDPEAWNMLVWCRMAPANQTSFWTQLRSKFIPTKSEQEHLKRVNDRGAPVLALIDRIQKARDAAVRKHGDGDD